MDSIMDKLTVKFWVQLQADIPDKEMIFSTCLLVCQPNGNKQNKTETINHPLLGDSMGNAMSSKAQQTAKETSQQSPRYVPATLLTTKGL